MKSRCIPFILFIADILFGQVSLSDTEEGKLGTDIVLDKKPLIILPTNHKEWIKDSNKYSNHYKISDKLLNIISEQATLLGRFRVIDRSLVDKVMKEQEFQLSGMVASNQVVKIGEFAAAKTALIVDIIHFGQKGVPKRDNIDDDDDDDNSDDDNQSILSWLGKTLVKEAIHHVKRRDTLAWENNINTEIRATVNIINIENGLSEYSFGLNTSTTGGNRNQSLSEALEEISQQVRLKLKEIYAITSEVIDINGEFINIFSGKNLGLKKGALFEVASKSSIKYYKGRTLNLPGNTKGLIQLVEVGQDASRAIVLRKWGKITPGQKAYELNGQPYTTDITLTYLNDNRNEIAGKVWFMPLSEFSASLNYHLGLIRDSRNNNDPYIGFGTDLDYRTFRIFGMNSSISLTIPALISWRGDDDGHNVFSFFSDPSIDWNISFQISKKRDIVISASYVFNHMHGPWQWRRDTGNNDEDGNSIMETEWGVWEDGMKPEFNLEGLYLSITTRRLRF